MSDPRCVLVPLPSDAGNLLKRFLADLGGATSSEAENLAAAAKFSVGLLLPRFAGTMLKLLYKEGALPGTELMKCAAAFQGVKPTGRDVGFRLAVALDYLRRTGCVAATDSTIELTPFGKEVYETRFRRKE